MLPRWEQKKKKTSTGRTFGSGGSVSHAGTVSLRSRRRPTYWPKSSMPSRAANKLTVLSLPPTPGTGRSRRLLYIHGACHVDLCRLVQASWSFLAHPCLCVILNCLFVFGALDFAFLYLYPGVGVGDCALCSVLILISKYYLLGSSIILYCLLLYDDDDGDDDVLINPM